MGGAVAIGEQVRVAGWALAGVKVVDAEGAPAVRQAWRTVDDDVALVILTAAAADHLADELDDLTWPLVVVMPE